jgi:hypothetical protein
LDAINRSKKRPVYILDVHGPAPEPEFFLNKMNCDVIVIREGENAVINLLKEEAFSPGLSYEEKKKEKIYLGYS